MVEPPPSGGETEPDLLDRPPTGTRTLVVVYRPGENQTPHNAYIRSIRDREFKARNGVCSRVAVTVLAHF